jgi:chromosome segregation ATPase
MYNELAATAKDLAQEAQNTGKELSLKQRELSKITRQATGARRAVQEAEAEAESMDMQLVEAQAVEITLEKQILEMQRRLNRVKQEVVSTGQSIGPKLK